MHEILTDIFMWSWFSEPHGYHFNGFFIRHPAGNLCIDPAEPDEAVLNELTHQGVARILLTNRNHVRAANRVRLTTKAPTAIHAADAAYARAQGAELDDELQVGEEVGPLVSIGVPGKSPGELAFYWPERKILLIGDAVIGNPPGSLGLLRESVMDDPPRLRESVRKLLDLDLDALLVGDGQPVLQDAKARLVDLVHTLPK
jgi:glyoxylase-like metal-dependent hydrolase (beta-lactamase superfamily II)